MNEIQVDEYLYSTTELASIHPGGPLFVELFNGKDATDAFLTYHRKAFPHKRLKEVYKLTVREYREKTLHDDLVCTDYLELCKEVSEVLSVHNSFAPTWYYAKAFLLLLVSFSLEFFIHYTVNYKWYYTGLLGWLFALIGLNIQHDANHGAISRYYSINRLFGLSQNWIGGSSIDWMHQHIVQHHIFCNDMQKDPDIAGVSPILRLNPSKSWYFVQYFQGFYVFILFAFFGFTYSVSSIRNLFNNWNYTNYSSIVVQKYMPFERTVTAICLSRWIIIPLLVSNSEELWINYVQIIPTFVVGGYYLSFFFLLSHCFEGTQHHSDFYSTDSTSVLKRQVTTSSNVGGEWLCFINGGLNYQIEHHLFPRMSHCHYPTIAPIVRKYCKKKNIPYKHFSTIGENVHSCVQYLTQLGNPTIQRKLK